MRTWERASGREITESELEELTSIYHARAVRAWVMTERAPRNRRALWKRTGNGLPFRALLVWHRETRAAGRECRSLLWGGGVERVQVQSIEALRARNGGEERDGETWGRLAMSAERESGGGQALRALARRARWARECVTVYHLLSGSRQWRSALADDLAVLAVAGEAGRGCGVADLATVGGSLLSGDGGHGSGALRKRLHGLRQRIASGDVLQSERPWECAVALGSYHLAAEQPARAERVKRATAPGLSSLAQAWPA